MIPQAHITAWRETAPWADDAQVEQDLVLSRATVEIFTDSELSDSLALRGGTALNKLFIHPPTRYSEDIDLVQAEPGAIGDVLNAIRSRLDPWLGRPKRSSSGASVTLVYRFESEVPPIRPLRLKIEINTREHFKVLDYEHPPLAVANPWFNGETKVTTYRLDELMGTKLRALYQRRKGRDLFDLWLCLGRGLLDPDQVVACFAAYMEHEKRTISRAAYERDLFEKETDSAFLDDIRPLLATGISYNVKVAATLVRESLISRLAGEPWRGRPSAVDGKKRGGPRRGKGRGK